MPEKHESKSAGTTDGIHFQGTWKVVAGDIGHKDPQDPPQPEYFAHIDLVHEIRGEIFKLSSRKVHQGITETSFAQDLRFNPLTGTLDSLAGEKPERCISFWDRKAIHGGRNCIFAMRRTDPADAAPESDLLPWEAAGVNGSWGAEGG